MTGSGDKIDEGWRAWGVVAGAFVVLGIGFGAHYTFGAFVEPLQAQFDVSRGMVSIVFSVPSSIYFTLGAVSGPIADRLPTRAVVFAGMVLVAAGMFLASRATTITEIAVAYGIGIGIGVGFTYVPAVGAVQRWFVVKRGFASGLAVSGVGVGTLALPPLAGWLIDLLGWRDAYVALAAITLAIGGGFALLLRGPPRAASTGDGSKRGARATSGATLRQALPTRPFVLIYASTFTVAMGAFIPFVHLVPYAEGHGQGRATGIFLVSLIGIGSTVGRFLLGGIADRLGRKRSLILAFIGVAISFAIWLAASQTWHLVAFALLFGSCYGGYVALLPAFITDFFGDRNVSSIIGASYTSVAFGSLVGPPLAGLAFDIAGSYALPIGVGACCALVSALCIVLMEEPGQFQARGGAVWLKGR